MRALAALLLVAVLASCNEDRVEVDAGGPTADGPVGADATGAPPPVAPPSETGPISLWLSSSRIPAADADLVAVLVNRGSARPGFGVEAAFDRWDGAGWVAHRRTAVCLDFWYCQGRLYALDEEGFAVQSIGIDVAPGGVGPTEWLRVEGLEPGWYRLRQVADEGDEATGVFEVVQGDVDLAPVGEIASEKLSLSPALVAEGGGSVSVRLLTSPEATYADEAHVRVRGAVALTHGDVGALG